MSKELKFNSGEEMLKYIQDNNDLYCEDLCVYVFSYNEEGSIAYYYIDPEDAKELQKEAKEADEYWAAFLGVGGHIIDDPSHELYEKSMLTNLDWCNEMYKQSWIATKDYN